MALSTRRRDRSYPSPITDFDDSNRESYIARSSGIGSLKPMGTIVDYNLGRGGRDPSMIGGFGLGPSGLMDPVIELPTGGPVDMIGEDRSDTTLDMLLNNVFKKQYEPQPTTGKGLQEMSGLFGPGPGLGDPTGEGGIIQRLGEFLGFTDPIDPENEGLPMDEFQELPRELLRGDEIAMDDTYSLPNLLQMINDARDAGNVDEIELLTNDLEMMYPGATMDVAELTDKQKRFMTNPYFSPDLPGAPTRDELFNQVKDREDTGFFGFGAQEPTTREEFDNYYNKLMNNFYIT